MIASHRLERGLYLSTDKTDDAVWYLRGFQFKQCEAVPLVCIRGSDLLQLVCRQAAGLVVAAVAPQQWRLQRGALSDGGGGLKYDIDGQRRRIRCPSRFSVKS